MQVDSTHDASFKLAGELNKGVGVKTNPPLVGSTSKENTFGDWKSWEDEFKQLTQTFKSGLKGLGGSTDTTEKANPVKTVMKSLTEKRLMRSSRDRKIMGVCGGVAEYFGIDPTWVRIAFLVGLFTGFSPLIYFIMAFAMPKDTK